MPVQGVEQALRGMIGHMSLEAFNADVRERRAAHFKSAIEPALLDSFVDLRRIERLLQHDDRLTPNIDVFDGAQLRRFVDRRAAGRTNFDAVSEHLLAGATIRIRDAERFDPRLAFLIEGLERRLAGRCAGNLYLTPPGKAGFPAHFDNTDVFVVQCVGKKHWRIYDRYANQCELPLPEHGWRPDGFAPIGAPREFDLERGDVFYLPRGTMHEAFCTDRESLHLTISLASRSFAELLRAAIDSAAAADVELRRRVPWAGAANERADAEGLLRQTKERLLEAVRGLDLGALLREERAEPLETRQAEPPEAPDPPPPAASAGGSR